MNYAIEKTGLIPEDIEYIRKVSLETIIKFFNAEFIGFCFGVPLAVVIAIGYGNIAEIFMDVYFWPVVITTIFIVTLVALPTNIYLIRDLIKNFLSPSLENLKKFSFSISRIPLIAAINLFFRISLGGLIADIWGFYTHGNVSNETFIGLFVSPTFGSWTASIVYFFALQNILASYNLKVRKYISITKRSELLKLKPLSMRSIYPLFISLTLFLSSGLIASGKLLGAGFVGQILIIVSTLIVLSLLISASYFTMKRVIGNINEILSSWEESKEQLGIYGLYDIEEVVRDVYQLQVFSSHIDETLKRLIEEAKGIPEKILSSSKIVIFGLNTFKSKLNLESIKFLDYQVYKKDFGQVNVFAKECVEVNEKIVGNINSLIMNFSSSSELIKGGENLWYIKGLEENVLKTSNELSKESIEVEKEVKRILSLSDDVISKISVMSKYSKDMEMIFINFQLEMSKIGYPMEFRFISMELSKLLDRMEEISKSVRWSIDNFKEMVKEVNVGIKNILVSYESETLVFSDIANKIRGIYEVFGEIKEILKDVIPKVRELKIDVNVLNTVPNELNIVMSNISKIYNLSKEIEDVYNEMYSYINEIQKILNSHTEIVKVIKRILYSYGLSI